MESTAADAMPDDTDLTPQAPEPEQPPAEASGDTSAEPANTTSTTSTEPAAAEANPVMELALKDLQDRRDALEAEINALSSRKQQLETELKANFAGQSDAIARRVKGFQEYLGGALQDLVQSVENLELVVQPMVVQPSPLDQAADNAATPDKPGDSTPPPAVADTFRPDEELIRQTLERFLKQPDVYADPWNLRRSIDARDTALLEDWFFNQGGRGAQPSRGTRLRNILVSAALIAVIGELYGDQFQCLVLAGEVTAGDGSQQVANGQEQEGGEGCLDHSRSSSSRRSPGPAAKANQRGN